MTLMHIIMTQNYYSQFTGNREDKTTIKARDFDVPLDIQGEKNK